MTRSLPLIWVSAAVLANAQSRPSNAAQAILRANELTSLQTVSGPPAATLVKVTEDVTPYLGDRNVGKQAWRVEYPKSSLKFGASTDHFRRTFIVMLERASGHLLFVTSRYEGAPDREMRPMPSCASATQQLRSEEEVYKGYPDAGPKVDFLAALGRILNAGVGNPLLAKEIHGAYVLHSHTGSMPQPVWAITLRGLPPSPADGRGANIPVWQRNHMRNVVDALSGQVLFATNSPQPR